MLEFNARNLVTLWGPRGEIADYASKQWNGLLADYYLPRWQKFFQHVGMTLREGKPLNQHSFLEKLLVFEQDWQTKIAGADLPTAPVGEALDIVQKLEKKYEQLISNSLRIDIYAQPIGSSEVVHAPGADLLAEQLVGRS